LRSEGDVISEGFDCAKTSEVAATWVSRANQLGSTRYGRAVPDLHRWSISTATRPGIRCGHVSFWRLLWSTPSEYIFQNQVTPASLSCDCV
jgi:hypothetical protein